jgi:hypothetical protein
MIFFRFALITLAALLTVSTTFAVGKSEEASITAVGKNSITIRNGSNPGYKIVVIESNGLKKTMPPANIDTYTVKEWTPITLNGLPAKLTDLKPGMKVRVSQGMDRTVAYTITATNVPPKQLANATDKTPPVKGKGPKKLGQGIDAYKVTAVTADTITVAQNGGKKSIAYRLGKFTEISVNGEESPFSKVRVGMEVTVVASTDPTIAASIEARDGE